MANIKVMIVDDHAIFRQGLKALFTGFDDVEIVGEAGNGREAIEKVRQLNPEVVLMDIGMPEMGGLEATKHIHKERPDVAVLILTQYEDTEYVLSLLRAGAKGYIAKTASAADLLGAVKTVSKGGSYLYPSATTALINEYLIRVEGYKSEYDKLTNREREILQLIAEGLSNQDIADKLFISIKTVLRHRTNLMEKLGFHNRTELIKYAISKGLIEVPHKPENIQIT